MPSGTSPTLSIPKPRFRMPRLFPPVEASYNCTFTSTQDSVAVRLFVMAVLWVSLMDRLLRPLEVKRCRVAVTCPLILNSAHTLLPKRSCEE